MIFDDLRKGNQEDAATYLAAQFVLYSFLAILAMITLSHIINSISMSVTARIRQYGAMRAVGMDGSQLTRMMIAEALTYCHLRARCRLRNRTGSEPVSAHHAAYKVFRYRVEFAGAIPLYHHRI